MPDYLFLSHRQVVTRLIHLLGEKILGSLQQGGETHPAPLPLMLVPPWSPVYVVKCGSRKRTLEKEYLSLNILAVVTSEWWFFYFIYVYSLLFFGRAWLNKRGNGMICNWDGKVPLHMCSEISFKFLQEKSSKGALEIAAVIDSNQIVLLSGICVQTDWICLYLHYLNELSERKWFAMAWFWSSIYVAEAKQSVFTDWRG